LAAAPVVSAFDPGDDCASECVAGGPGLSVQDVLLQQRKEALHGRVVGGSGDLAHRADHGVTDQPAVELSGTKLSASTGVDDAAGHFGTVDAASGDGVVQRSDGEAAFIRESMG
jgi:hypothetical protein